MMAAESDRKVTKEVMISLHPNATDSGKPNPNILNQMQLEPKV